MMGGAHSLDVRRYIRTLDNYPQPGVRFRDLSPLLADGLAFARTIDALVALVAPLKPDRVIGIEARGFLFSAPLAARMGIGLVCARKPGKLPSVTPTELIGVDYSLEYGADRLEVLTAHLSPDSRVVIIDDLIATGGTALAAHVLAETAGAQVVGAAFVIDLPFLGGADRLRNAGVPNVMALTGFQAAD